MRPELLGELGEDVVAFGQRRRLPVVLSPGQPHAVHEHAEDVLRVGVADRPGVAEPQARVLAQRRDVAVVREHVHAAAELAGEGLGVAQRALAIRRLADVREHDVAVVLALFDHGVVFVFHPDWVSQVSLFPVAVDRVCTVHRMLIPRAPEGEKARAHFDKSHALIYEHVFEQEDFAIAENIQSALPAMEGRSFVAGGFERGLALFHDAVQDAIERMDEPTSTAG